MCNIAKQIDMWFVVTDEGCVNGLKYPDGEVTIHTTLIEAMETLCTGEKVAILPDGDQNSVWLYPENKFKQALLVTGESYKRLMAIVRPLA